MTIDAYMSRYHIKRKETVIKWILNGYIPNANLGADYIPNSARMPYTSARAKNAKAIYKSIIDATMQLKHVVPELYNNITGEEFDGYIRRLAESGYIEIRTEDGVCYYDATLKTANFNLKDIIQFTRAVSAGVAEGVTTAALNQYAHT